MSQLGGLAKDHTKFEETGAKILALAVQSQEEAATSVKTSDAQYPVLSDSDHAVADAYGVYDLFPDLCGAGKATSSVFIINQDGQIIWDNISNGGLNKVPSSTILENLPG